MSWMRRFSAAEGEHRGRVQFGALEAANARDAPYAPARPTRPVRMAALDVRKAHYTRVGRSVGPFSGR
jgi:hypothetical protein